jgi:hypothetical protein
MLLLGCIYKSPSSSPENLDELNKPLITVSKEKKFSHIMVMGDFNFPKIDWKNWLTKGFSGLLLGLLYIHPSNNISLLFSLICAHTLSSNFSLNFISSDFSFLLIYNAAH